MLKGPVPNPRLSIVRGAGFPDPEAVSRAAEVLNAGRKVVVLAGQGALHASEELAETAALLGAPVCKALLGKAVLPDAHPYVTGGVGYLGARASQQVLEACDTLLIVGSNFPYIEYYPKPDQARGVQIDIDPARIGLRYLIDAPLAGEAAECLRALNAQLKRKEDRVFLKQAQQWKADWLTALTEGAHRPGKPMKPERVVWELNRRLVDDAIIVADSGYNTALAAQHLMIRGTQKFGVSGTLASMGSTLPYAVAAAFAFPNRQVVGERGPTRCGPASCNGAHPRQHNPLIWRGDRLSANRLVQRNTSTSTTQPWVETWVEGFSTLEPGH